MGTRLSSSALPDPHTGALAGALFLTDTNAPALKYDRRSTLSACKPGNFTEQFTVHRNAVNGITVVSFNHHINVSLTVHRYAISGSQFCKLIIIAILTASVPHRIIRVILLW